MRVIDKIFELPPVEKRGFLPAFLWFLLDQKMDKGHDDTYIYYLTLKCGIIIGLVLSLLNWISYIYQVDFNFFLFKISLSKENFVREFIWSYTIYYSLILLIPVNLFFYQKMKRNVDIRTFDSLWWISSKKVNPKNFKKTISQYRRMYWLIPPVMLISGCVGKVIADRNSSLYQSNGFFILILAFYTVSLSQLNAAILMAKVVLRNYKARLRAQNEVEVKNKAESENEYSN